MLPCSMTRSLPSRDFSAAGEELAVDDLLGALLHDEDLVEERLDVLVAADLADQLGAEVGAVHRGDADGHAAGLRPVGGDVGDPAGLLDDDVGVTGHHVEPVPAAVDERGQGQVELEAVGALLRGGRRVDALRAAVGHRAVDGDRGTGTADGDVEGHLLHDGPASPVAGGEPVEVGAGRDPLAVVDPEPAAVEDRVGVQGGAGRDRLAQRGPVEVLGAAARADRLLVGVEDGRLGVDVQRHHVEVAVGRQHEALQHLADGVRAAGGTRRVCGKSGCHSSTPPDVSAAPSEKCGRSLFSYIDSADPMAMCMSRYL